MAIQRTEIKKKGGGLKRSAPPQRKTPLKRSGPPKCKSALKRSGPPKSKGTPKSKKGAAMKRGSDEAKEYMGRVAGLGCAICRLLGYGPTPAQVHHKKEGTGMGRRAPDDETMPLCFEHHEGATGIHKLKSHGFLERYGVTEDDLIQQTRAALGYVPRAE